MITLGLVANVDDDGVYVTMPGSRGVLRGPYKALSTIAAGTTVLVASTDDGEQVVVGPSSGGVGAVSVTAFGAVGDGTTDDTTALQAALRTELSVIVPAGTYRITDEVEVPGGCRILGQPGAEIKQVTSGKSGLVITGGNVVVEGLTLTGRHSTATHSALEHAVRAVGVSSVDPLDNVRLVNLDVRLWGASGVWLQYVDGFTVTRSAFQSIGYGAVMCLSVSRGSITDNRIDGLVGSGGNAYGIALTRGTSDSLVDDPLSEQVTIRGNVIHGSPWEGIDTHGGRHITIADNVVTGCYRGISLTGADDSDGVYLWAPKHVTVSGNVVDSLLDDGTATSGVSVAGAAGATVGDPATDYAEQITLVGNVIRCHGLQSNFNDGAIFARSTSGLVIANNALYRSSPHAVGLYYDNMGFTVTGNTSEDVWATAANAPSFVHLASDNNVGTISGNTHRAGSKSATYLNESGVRDDSGAEGGSAYVYGANDLAVTYELISAYTLAARTLIAPSAAAKLGFHGAAPIVKPTVMGSAAGNVALQSLLATLQTYGLITDSTT